MTSPVFYILVALVFTSAIIAAVFFLAWKSLGEKPYALNWSIAFMAATLQWTCNLYSRAFPSHEFYWLTVSALALVVITLSLRGHCQRTSCQNLPDNLWPFAAAAYSIILWATLIDPHVGISTAIAPALAAVALFLTAIMIIRHRQKSRAAEWAAAVTMVVFGTTQAIAAGMGFLQGPNGIEFYRELYLHFNFLTLPAGYTGMAMFVIFMLASDLSEEMKDIAVRDQLTGLLNRRGFGEQAAKAFAIARRSDQPLSIIMTDIDRFKSINDEFGHAAGDAALEHFSRLMRLSRRTEDVLARVGGEEFSMILPGTTLEHSLRIADGLCGMVNTSPLMIDGQRLQMTASFGVATISDKDSCLADIIMRADKALYRSKREGRNRVDLESSQRLKILGGELGTLRG